MNIGSALYVDVPINTRGKIIRKRATLLAEHDKFYLVEMKCKQQNYKECIHKNDIENDIIKIRVVE